LLEVKSLSKSFDDFLAVDSISFRANKGEVLGFLGPNGAGKSTSMKMITGFLEPSDGEVFVCGKSILKEKKQAQSCIGYVPENAPLYEEMTVIEHLNFVAELRGLKEDSRDKAVARAIEATQLKDVIFQKVETLSKGFKRRLCLAGALVHDPEVLILDEPTDGLDPNQKHEVRELIRKLSKEKCILISTHILEEVEEVCDRCIIIGRGKKLFEGSPDDLKSKSKSGRIHDVFRVITTGVNHPEVQL
jgi:ABC-2 type transport system ATP-binding protein